MKLVVDVDRCEGHQQCHAVDPDLFPLTDEGYSAVSSGTEVSPEEQAVAVRGVDACPLMALRLEE